MIKFLAYKIKYLTLKGTSTQPNKLSIRLKTH